MKKYLAIYEDFGTIYNVEDLEDILLKGNGKLALTNNDGEIEYHSILECSICPSLGIEDDKHEALFVGDDITLPDGRNVIVLTDNVALYNDKPISITELTLKRTVYDEDEENDEKEITNVRETSRPRRKGQSAD